MAELVIALNKVMNGKNPGGGGGGGGGGGQKRPATGQQSLLHPVSLLRQSQSR